MAKYPAWQDEYWLMLMQLYLKQPQGVKPLYSRALVDLALELHFPPDYLYRKMFKLRQIDMPSLQRLWDTYAGNPERLSGEVSLLKRMNGFGASGKFYAGVAINESWEKDFKPVDGLGNKRITPVLLIVALDLYFRLTPNTMVAETPEIAELAKLTKVKRNDVVAIMRAYQAVDPYLTNKSEVSPTLLAACEEVWKRYGNEDPQKIAATAAQLKEYWK